MYNASPLGSRRAPMNPGHSRGQERFCVFLRGDNKTNMCGLPPEGWRKDRERERDRESEGTCTQQVCT